MKKLSFLLFLFLPFGLFAQELATNTAQKTDSTKKVEVDPALMKKEMDIKTVFDSILTRDTRDADRVRLNDLIYDKLLSMLKDSGSFTHPFDSLKNLGKIYSDDYSIRVYTWCCEMEDMSYKFWGIIQDLDNDAIYPMTQLNGQVYVPGPTQQILLKRWYGALYYKVIRVSKKKDDPKYIMLGWSQPNVNTKMKILEVLDIKPEEHKVMLGDKIFKGYKGKKNYRHVFTYCSDLAISLKYEEQEKRFVFDHLTPLSDDRGNARGCNGPDMSYDALKRKKRWFRKTDNWVIKKDVDVRNIK